MANTLHGPFVKGASLSTGSYGTGVGQVNTYTSGNANNDETQSAVALHSFNPDLLSAFVLSGVTCTKDGTTASQLDVASGYAYLTQSDGTLARCDVASTTFSTSGNISTTMYLDLNPDGSWSWSTSHSAVANHITICSVTTDASGNIATVTDARPIATLLSGAVAFPAQIEIGPLSGSVAASSAMGTLYYSSGGGALVATGGHVVGGANTGVVLQAWTGGGSAYNAFGVGADNVATETTVNHLGVFTQIASQATAGSFGVPVIVAQAINTAVTVNTDQQIVTFTPGAAGLYRVSAAFTYSNTSASTVTLRVTYYDPNTAGTTTAYFTTADPSGGALNGRSFGAGTASEGTFPVTFYAGTGASIIVHYLDSAGTPNDHVSAMIERLS